MVELIDKWEVVSKLITLQNNYNFFKNEWDAERLYREIAKLEIGIGKIPGKKIVECKNCVNYCGFEHCTNGICDLDSVSKRAVYPDDFCSYGERKDNEKL